MVEQIPVRIAREFLGKDRELKVQKFGNGHIHFTYLVEPKWENSRYILQQLNTNVFPDPELLISNHLKLYKQFTRVSPPAYTIPQLIPVCNTKTFLFEDETGTYWRLMEFIQDSYAIDKIEDTSFAEEAGLAYGWFLSLTDTLDPGEFKLSIPDFHSVKFRNQQLFDAIEKNSKRRKESSANIIKFFIERKNKFEELEALGLEDRIPIRLTHNDTKINNVLFRNNQSVAVIDLDTIGPGLVFYDYGDSLRTIANLSLEDEKDLDKVGLNKKAFYSYTKGFLKHTSSILTPPEKNLLYLAPQLMTYIIGVRFLADYLNGDIYFKTQYAEHNLVRTLVQQKLLESLEENESYIKETIQSIFD